MNEEPRLTNSTLTDSQIIVRIFKYLLQQKWQFLLSIVLMVVAVVLNLILPIIFGKTAVILGSEDIQFSQVIILVIVYAVCLIAGAFINFYQSWILQIAGQKIIYQLREDIFRHVEKFSAAQINSMPIGKLVTRVTSDTNTLNELFTSLLINLIKNALLIVGVLVAMFLVNTKLTFYVLLVTPIIGFVSFFFRKFSRSAYREVRHHISAINAFLAENLSGMKITQVFNQEAKKAKEFDERNNDLKRSSIKQIFIFAIFRPFIYVLYIATIMLIFWVGTADAISGGFVTFAILLIFYQYIDRLFNPIQQLAEEFNVLQSAFASSERIFEILDMKPEIIDHPHAIELETLKGEIEFKHVWFRYTKEEWVLQDVSFKINPRETVAFVGATGSGKTTILSLIVRNYDIQKGQILIDGIDIQKIKLDSLRRHIGQMLQDVFLFSGTVASNIKMKEDTFTDEEMKQACEYVNANHFIEKLPKAYDEEVRERGNNFSAGQRQLLSFARTIVHQPKVMILDEATANIDTETELLIQDSLTKMMNIGTMIIVAHRLSTIQHADNIIVLQKGKIIETGNHQALLKQKGHYYKLYQLQYQSQEQKGNS
ncbi:MAG: ABC transporter ATP-binding protein [Bacilli bacterium]|jgi:ATP-binding cassette subfamily B protein|nr:ABC transporter ATP-binding protein [Bacilli bacterium]